MNDLAQTMSEALVAEEEIAARADEIRGEDSQLNRALFLALWPLLKEPIQPAFIQSVPATKGKPYPSTGIRSVQVQIDRMNNVLTPMGWWDNANYESNGKLCTVTVSIGDWRDPEPLLNRSSRGGVSHGSTEGNLYKGSYTNAAKVAFARIGPGHEVYLGATDLDPDVSAELASEKPSDAAGMIGTEIAAKLVDHAWNAGEKDRLRLAASRLVEKDVGDCSTKAKAKAALTGALTFEQADRLERWLSEKGGQTEGER